MSWSDASGNLWLFGGGAYDSIGNLGSLNDLWEFNPKLGTNGEWTWMGGISTLPTGYVGVYTATTPGGRSNAASWIDASGNLWLFGGYGFGWTSTFSTPVFAPLGSGTSEDLIDLWKYQP